MRLTGGQAAEGPQLAPFVDALPRRPRCVVADRGYSYPCHRREMRRRRVGLTCPERADHKAARLRRGVRGPAFDLARYRDRNAVERCVRRLKDFRAVATRSDKTALSYAATVTVAAILLWLRNP